METISSELLDQIEDFLSKRIDITADGKPNEAMRLLKTLQDEREEDAAR